MRSVGFILSFFLLLFLSGVAFGQSQDVYAHANPIEHKDISKSISLYPNPATEFVTIKLGTLEYETTKISVYNILGSEIQVEKERINDHEARIRVKDLASGYYLLAVRDDQLQFKATYKFLKR